MRDATAAGRRKRVIEICAALPEVTVRDSGRHIKFEVRGKTVAYYLNDHHGDGRIALCCKVPPGENTRMISGDPERCFMPSYLGPKGWVGLRIDLRRIDWGEVERLIGDSYQLTAPRRLAALARSGSP
jgi:phosphoribosylglycinamide formyltransferase-1